MMDLMLNSMRCFSRYPLSEFARENAAEDERCLTKVQEIFDAQKKKGCPISGVNFSNIIQAAFSNEFQAHLLTGFIRC